MGLFSGVSDKRHQEQMAQQEKKYTAQLEELEMKYSMQISELEKKLANQEKEMQTLQNSYDEMTKKFAFYKETLETLDAMKLSQEEAVYIERRKKTLTLISLINAASEKKVIPIERQQEALRSAVSRKNEADIKIEKALGYKPTDVQAEDKDYLTEETVDASKLAFYRYSEGAVITGYNGSKNKKLLVIPDRIQGVPVIGVGNSAFQNAEFERVRMPDTICFIESNAFNRCKKLRVINLPENLMTLGSYSFAETGIKEIVIPNKVLEIPLGCFEMCRELKKVTLNQTLVKIGPEAFSSTGVRKIVIPESVTDIEKDAFGKSRFDKTTTKQAGIEFTFFRTEKISVSSCGGLGENPTVYGLYESDIRSFSQKQGYKFKLLSELEP